MEKCNKHSFALEVERMLAKNRYNEGNENKPMKVDGVNKNLIYLRMKIPRH